MEEPEIIKQDVLTVGELVSALKNVPQNAKIFIDRNRFEEIITEVLYHEVESKVVLVPYEGW